VGRLRHQVQVLLLHSLRTGACLGFYLKVFHSFSFLKFCNNAYLDTNYSITYIQCNNGLHLTPWRGFEPTTFCFICGFAKPIHKYVQANIHANIGCEMIVRTSLYVIDCELYIDDPLSCTLTYLHRSCLKCLPFCLILKSLFQIHRKFFFPKSSSKEKIFSICVEVFSLKTRFHLKGDCAVNFLWITFSR
jgi:hypothetical protein